MDNKEKIMNIILKMLLKENEDSILNVRGGRGYGAGHPYPKKIDKPLLGKVEGEKEEKESQTKIKVSKRLTKKKRNK